MWHDWRYAVRRLLKSPGFTVVASLSLALGIGANTTVFCWIQNALLRPVPGARHPAALVVLCSTRGAALFDTVSYPDLKDYATLTEVFAGVIGSQVTPACLTVDGQPEWVYGQIATANFFDLLGVKPVLGRTFLAEEEETLGGHPVLVLSHGFWRRRFGSDPNVIGKTVELNRHSFTIVGVASPGFQGTMPPLNCDFWAPLVMHQQVAHFGNLRERGDRWLHTQGRLRPGVSLAQAQAAVLTLGQQLEQAHPANRGIRLRVLPPWQAPYGGQPILLPVLRILLAVSLGVLLIVSANVANLLLVRGSSRRKEIAIRLAVGAQPWHLIRQLLTESVVLALLGGGLGVLLANWSTRLLMAFLPTTYLPLEFPFHLDASTLGFTLVLTLATAVVFGLAPALKAARPDLHDSLKEGGRTCVTGGAHHRLRSGLVVSEIALALLLLIGAGLCIKGSQRARRVDPGFQPTNALVAGLRLGAHGYDQATAQVFYRQLRERLAAVPGVRAAALASWFPLGFEGGPSTYTRPEGYQPAPSEDLSVRYSIVSQGYFNTMGIPLLEGRDFTERDDAQAPGVAVINETLARRHWPGQSALGRTLRVFGDRTVTVIGVVKSGKYRSLSEPATSFAYYHYLQGVPDLNLGAILRTTGAPEPLAPALRREIRALDPAVEVFALLTLEDFIEAAFVGQRIAATLLVVLGLVAIALAAIGIYGVMAYVVTQRTHEIGIRMALGAQPRDVLRLVVHHGLRLGGLGVGLGLLGAFALTRLLASFLYGVSPFDPATFLGVSCVLGVVALAASLIPARRAAKVDPLVALRYE